MCKLPSKKNNFNKKNVKTIDKVTKSNVEKHTQGNVNSNNFTESTPI